MGTFRFFQAASQGRFTQAVSFDYSPEVTDFNLGIIQILRTSSNRFDFLSNLFGKPELAMQLRSFEQGKISSDTLFRYASEIIRINLDTDYISSKSIFPKTIHESSIGKFALALLEIFVDKSRGHLSFIGSNDAFENLKSLSVANKIHVVNGNLSGSNTLFQLGDSLRKIGENISVLDISNAYKYISISGAEGQFLQNLKSLPLSTTAVVAFTEGNFLNKKRGGDGWDYYVVPARIYLNSASLFAVSNSAEIYPYPYHIFIEKVAKPFQKIKIIEHGKSCSQIFASH